MEDNIIMTWTASPRHRRRRGALLLRQPISFVAAAILSLLLLTGATVSAQRQRQRQRYETIEGHDCFRNLQGSMDAMFDLAATYPDLLSISDVGDSYLKSVDGNNDDYPLPRNGYDIYAANVTSSSSSSSSTTIAATGGRRNRRRLLPSSAEKGKTLIISGVHPREYAPPELALRFVESLLGGYGNDADITWMLDNTEIHVIFHVNPDSRYITETYPDTFWRKNQNPENGKCRALNVGVDLNRNYDFMWGERDGASDDECDGDYHGKRAGSEPETRAVIEYARRIFPEEQRRDDAEKRIDEALGEDIMGIFVDIHSPGGYIFYPWGHIDEMTEDDHALQATARKMSYFNGYTLWAGGQPDFPYPTSGDSSDYMYAVLGVASFGLELGEDFYEDCKLFENRVVPENLSALTYLAKNAKKPFSLSKGPDVIDLALSNTDIRDGIQYAIEVTVVASDARMVNSIDGYPDFPETGGQGVAEVTVYLDVHPDDFEEGVDEAWKMGRSAGDDDSFEVEATAPEGFSAGRHVLYVQARDGDGYLGPATGAFFDVESRPTDRPSSAPLTNKPTTGSPSRAPTPAPTPRPSKEPSSRPTTAGPSARPTQNPTAAPLSSPVTAGPSASPSVTPTGSPSSSPTPAPSRNPSKAPSDPPTAGPSSTPTTSRPTSQPSSNPSTDPSLDPSGDPSFWPSNSPSLQPTKARTAKPTSSPTVISLQSNPSEPTPTDSNVTIETNATSDASANLLLLSDNTSSVDIVSNVTLPSPSENSSHAARSLSAFAALVVLPLSTLYFC